MGRRARRPRSRALRHGVADGRRPRDAGRRVVAIEGAAADRGRAHQAGRDRCARGSRRPARWPRPARRSPTASASWSSRWPRRSGSRPSRLVRSSRRTSSRCTSSCSASPAPRRSTSCWCSSARSNKLLRQLGPDVGSQPAITGLSDPGAARHPAGLAAEPAPTRHRWSGRWWRGSAEKAETVVSGTARTRARRPLSAVSSSECRLILNDRYPFSPGASREVPIADFGRLFGYKGIYDDVLHRRPGTARRHLAAAVGVASRRRSEGRTRCCGSSRPRGASATCSSRPMPSGRR